MPPDVGGIRASHAQVILLIRNRIEIKPRHHVSKMCDQKPRSVFR